MDDAVRSAHLREVWRESVQARRGRACGAVRGVQCSGQHHTPLPSIDPRPRVLAACDLPYRFLPTDPVCVAALANIGSRGARGDGLSATSNDRAATRLSARRRPFADVGEVAAVTSLLGTGEAGCGWVGSADRWSP